ncbi:MAG: AMP-binding protein [Devosia sp.]
MNSIWNDPSLVDEARPILRSTIPAALASAAEIFGSQGFLRSKRLGAWTESSWEAVAAEVRSAAKGFISLGLQPGQIVAVVSRNRREAVIAELAAVSSGAVSAAVTPGLFASPAELFRAVNPAIVVVDGAAQSEWLESEDLARTSNVKIVCVDRVPDEHVVEAISWEELLGRGGSSSDLDVLLSDRATVMDPDEVALLSLSAGTMGPPSVTGLTHRFVLANCEALQERVQVGSQDLKLTFLPWSRSDERLLSIYLPILTGMRIAFPESEDTVAQDLRDTAPTILSAAPRHLRLMQTEVLDASRLAGSVPRAFLSRAMALGSRIAVRMSHGHQASFFEKGRYVLAQLLGLRRVRRHIGIHRVRQLIVIDETISADLAFWFLSLGAPIAQGWGTASTAGVLSLDTFPTLKIGSVGRALSCFRVAPDSNTSELKVRIIRSENTGDNDSGLPTGDIGSVQSDGTIKILAKAGHNTHLPRPHRLAAFEARHLLTDAIFVRDALMCQEEEGQAVVALLLNRQRIEQYAHREGVAFSDYQTLLRTPQVSRLIQAHVDSVNKLIGPHFFVRDYQIVESELLPGDHRLTPAMKLRHWRLV